MKPTGKTRKVVLYRHKRGTAGHKYADSDYVCFGDYDAMAILPIEESGEFENLCKDVEILDENVHAQVFFTYRPIINNCDKDNSFWSSTGDSDYRILTATFVKLKNPENVRNEKLLKFELSDNIIAYNTIGGVSDIVIFAKNDEYKKCNQDICSIIYHNELASEIEYAYTVSAFPAKYWQKCNNNCDKEDCTNKCAKYIEELYRVSFSLAVKNQDGQQPESLQLIKELKDKNIGELASVASMLGDYDVRIVYTDVNFHELIQLYREGGPLHYLSPAYINSIHNCVTRIHTEIKPHDNIPVVTSSVSELNPFYDVYIAKVIKWKNARGVNHVDCDIAKTMHSILLALRQASISRLGYETSDRLKPKVKLFIDLMEKYIYRKSPDFKLSKRDYDSISAFLMRVYTIIVTANIGSLDLFQSQSIDMKLYNTPHNLIMFYVKYAESMRNLLCKIDGSESKHYEFLFLTDVASNREIEPIFPDADGFISGDNVLLVSVSENDLYSNHLLVTLAHEVSHDVGDAVRCRESRKELLIKVIVGFFCLSLQTLVEEHFINNQASATSMRIEMVNRMLKDINDLIQRKSVGNKNHAYSKYVKDDVFNAFNEYINSPIYDDLISYVTSTIWRLLLKETNIPGGENIWDKHKKLHQIHTDLINIKMLYLFSNIGIYVEDEHNPYRHLFGVKELISRFINCCQEVQADTISLLTLDPKPDDYVKHFIVCIPG